MRLLTLSSGVEKGGEKERMVGGKQSPRLNVASEPDTWGSENKP